MPSALVPAVMKLAAGVLYLGLHVVCSGYAPLSSVYDPSFISTQPFLFRCVYLYGALVAQRF